MNVELPVGMMTPYFVTQADHSITDLENPAVLFSRGPLTIDTLALFFAFLEGPLPPPKPGLRLFGKRKVFQEPPSAVARARAMLQAITAEHRWPGPMELVNINLPVVALGNTVESDVLQALTVMKLRGYTLTVAMDISPCPDLASAFFVLLDREKPDGIPLFTAPDGRAAGFGSYGGLTVVSGLRATVLATGLKAAQILDEHPALMSQSG